MEIPAWFGVLPERFIQELAKHEPTGSMGDNTWHEVQFEMDSMIAQVAVYNGKRVAFPQSDVDKFIRIVKVWHKDEL